MVRRQIFNYSMWYSQLVGETVMEGIQRIVVPIDKSESSRIATDRAAQLAKLFNVNIEIIYVDDSQQFMASSALEERLKKENERILQEYKMIVSARDVQANITLLAGPSPAEEILKFANEKDLIVMASHNKRGFDRFILGSVSEEILRRSTCAVLIVKPDVQYAENFTPL
jgi:nucleotide-binding universal stress UspA family protein